MYEVEVKVACDHEPVVARLSALGARSNGVVVQEDTYYDAPHREFAETDEALRIRRETGSNGETAVRTTYKGPLVEAGSKTRREVETEVADADALDELFQAVGFEPAASVRKERARYELNGFTVTLDTVDNVGEFVEVETEAAEDGIGDAREGAYDVLRSLELDPDTQIRTSYLELLLGD